MLGANCVTPTLEKAIGLAKTNKIEAEGEKAYSYVHDLSWDSITEKFDNNLKSLL
ncbi:MULTISPECIES: hypothetical protein [Methanosarcina]|uniref:hypothetical protein n=1 Tax=Methanosarcina TaxID=2207 RepID=UPI000AD7CEF7|nr:MULTISPECIES: hypothetical protein [Methanosarcina]